MEVTVFWLALTFGVHIAMVNLGIFLALFVPYFKWKADKAGDAGLDKVAYKMMRFYAATYAVAGVFGTAYTVFLLSYYPDFIGLAGHITLIPFGIAILMIALHFFSIATFYYGWYKWERSVHHTIGVLLAISALLIPFGFRAVFAFLNVPEGLYLKPDGTLGLDVGAALANPTFLPLYLKSIVAAVTAGAIAVIGGLAYSYARSDDEEYKRGVEHVVKTLAPVAAGGLILMFILGLWYALSLRVVPYKFNNIFASLGWSVAGGKAEYNVAWVFVLKMILYLAQVYVVFTAYKLLSRGEIPVDRAKTLLATGFIALATIVLGEYLNAFSQYPYFIACLGSPEHCDLLKKLPPDAVKQLAPILDLRQYNELATIGPVTGLTVAFMIFLIAVAVYFFYAVFLKPEQAAPQEAA